MAAEAFDPFANDEDDAFLQSPVADPPRGGASPIVPPPRDTPVSPRTPPRRDAKSVASHFSDVNSSYDSSDTRRSRIRADAAVNKFGNAFPSVDLNDSGTDQFGFPSSAFPFAFGNPSVNDINTSGIAASQGDPKRGNLVGVTFGIAEEMSVIHKSQTNHFSVKVHGNISLEVSPRIHPSHPMQYDVSVLDPEGHLDAADSKNYDCAEPIASAKEFTSMNPVSAPVSDAAFRISIPEDKEQKDRWLGRPIIEYTCRDKFRPVPMLISTKMKASKEHYQITFQLRVNPRNRSPLSNGVVLVSVPDAFDGEKARVSSVVRAAGKGDNDTNWSDITRILSWRLGEMGGGDICEFEARFPRSDAEPAGETGHDADANFPVLLRYDSEGSLLSGVDLDFGEGVISPSVKRKFRVYHREV